MLGIFWLRPGRDSAGLTMPGSAPPSKSKMLAIMLRLVVDDVTAKFEEAADEVRGMKAAAEEAAVITPRRTGREVKNFIVK
jgi:hypothetical protein